MFSRILKILKESISSVTNANQWEMITKDMLEQGITGYRPMVRNQPVESCPRFLENQLVIIKYHPRFPHLHKEVGIVLSLNDCDTLEGMGSIHFYEILVGDEKITVIERYLDEFREPEENIDEDR